MREAPLPLVIFDEDTFVEKDFPMSLPSRFTYLSSCLRAWPISTNSWADRCERPSSDIGNRAMYARVLYSI